MQNKKTLIAGLLLLLLAIVVLFVFVFLHVYLVKQRLVTSNQQETLDTADWKTYTNTEYGFEVQYPADWITDVNHYNSGGISFCPPEMRSSYGCAVGKTNGGSIDPKTPISLWQCSTDANVRDCGSYVADSASYKDRVNLGIPPGSKYFYLLTLNDPAYRDVYNKMLKNFRTSGITVILPWEDSIWKIGNTETVVYTLPRDWAYYAGTCVDVFLLDYKGDKILLSPGNYISQGNTIDIKIVSDNSGNLSNGAQVLIGSYRVGIDARFCAETNIAFISSGVSASYITVAE